MKTYAESQREQTFDWNKFLNKEFHSYGELKQGLKLSSSWVTCACGNQCAIIPRLRNGEPIDEHLRTLGRQFSIAINNMFSVNYYENSKVLAKAILRDIEKRSLILIDQEFKLQQFQ